MKTIYHLRVKLIELMKYTTLFYISLFFSILHLSVTKETAHLSYFETFNKIKIRSRFKRSSTDNQGTRGLIKDVQFKAFHRQFQLALNSGSPVLARGFRARMIHIDGSSTFFTLDQSQLFTGHLKGDPNSRVSAHLEGQLWSIQIVEKGETFVVEPAHRLLTFRENPTNDTLVAYRLSDLKDLPDEFRFCGVPDNRNVTSKDEDRYDRDRTTDANYTATVKGGEFKTRYRRRASYFRDTCMVHLMGDAYVFNKRCHRDPQICAALMISFLQHADHLFRRSKFLTRSGRVITGIGLQVSELSLLTDYGHPVGTRKLVVPHFNVRKEWHASNKLDSFAAYMGMHKRSVCIHHLFTEFKDQLGVLGRAFTDVLCGWRHGGRNAYNTGITSGTNSAGFVLPSLMSKFVFAHEVGHNFGSTHDPDSTECAPDYNHGGKYLMWRFAVRGKASNNPSFSSCSRKQIGRKVPSWCFKYRSQVLAFCGNGVVDKGEECDAGAHGQASEDRCCSPDCRLRSGADCCDFNHECCNSCKIARAKTPCRQLGYIHGCEQVSYCSGTSTVCPEGRYKPDGTPCGDQHVCLKGKCAGPCDQAYAHVSSLSTLAPCRCEGNSTEACMWCCADVTDRANIGECRPIVPRPRENGSPCDGGICVGGVCVIKIITVGSNIRSYIGFAPMDSVSKFFRSNIVLTVILCSLFVWLPSAGYVYRNDRDERHRREACDAKLERFFAIADSVKAIEDFQRFALDENFQNKLKYDKSVCDLSNKEIIEAVGDTYLINAGYSIDGASGGGSGGARSAGSVDSRGTVGSCGSSGGSIPSSVGAGGGKSKHIDSACSGLSTASSTKSTKSNAARFKENVQKKINMGIFSRKKSSKFGSASAKVRQSAV